MIEATPSTHDEKVVFIFRKSIQVPTGDALQYLYREE